MLSHKRTLLRRAAWRLIIVAACLVAAGLLCATLVRFAPGSSVDERELDARLSSRSIAAIRQAHQSQQNVLHFYATYLNGAFRGDFGNSDLLQQPISKLVQDRWSTTAENIGFGLAIAWPVVLAIAFLNVTLQRKALDVAVSAVAGTFLSIPAAVVALLIAMSRKPASLAIAIAVLPVLYRYTRDVLDNSWNRPWIMAAFSRGVGRVRVLLFHVVTVAAPQLIALAGVSLTLAFSAAVPIEVLSDSPGIGQLAWQAAIGRDLPLVVTITMLVATVTLLANAAATLMSEMLGPTQA
jgi:peptide/nickel transport system permease protein